MAGIRFADGVTLWAGDAAHGAGKVLLVDASGNPTYIQQDSNSSLKVAGYDADGASLAFPAGRDRATLFIANAQTGTPASGVKIWALRNVTSGKVLYVRRMHFQMFFTGTGAASEQLYEVMRGTSVTAVTGGANPGVAGKRSSLSNSDIELNYALAGVTLTGLVNASPIVEMGWARLTHSATQAGSVSPPFDFDFFEQPIELAYQEVLYIQLGAVAVIGDALYGMVDVSGG